MMDTCYDIGLAKKFIWVMPMELNTKNNLEL